MICFRDSKNVTFYIVYILLLYIAHSYEVITLEAVNKLSFSLS